MPRLLTASLVAVLLVAAPLHAAEDDTVYQVSTISTLMEGGYDGMASVGELGKQGDFGIGTFDALDGEMVVLDGRFVQVKSDGRAYAAGDAATTPFAVVKRFKADKAINIEAPLDMKALQELIDKAAASESAIVALRVEGVFDYMKVRSVPRQTKPYPPLAEAAKGQSVFEYKGVKGTLVGFRMPRFMEGVNVPGWHLHFLSGDGKTGGHVLDCRVKSAEAQVDESTAFRMRLPDAGPSVKAPSAYKDDLEKIEK